MNLIHMAAIKHITFNKISSTCIYNCVAMKHTPQTILLSLALFVQLVVLYNSLFCTTCRVVQLVVLYYSLFCTSRCFVLVVVLYYSLFCTTRCVVLFVVLFYSLFCSFRCKFQVFSMIQFSLYNIANTQLWRVHYFDCFAIYNDDYVIACILRSLEISSTVTSPFVVLRCIQWLTKP